MKRSIIGAFVISFMVTTGCEQPLPPRDLVGEESPEDIQQEAVEEQVFELTNSTSFVPGLLFRGQGLQIFTDGSSSQLAPSSVYDFEVFNERTEETLSYGQLLTTPQREIEPYTVLFDSGQFNDIERGDTLTATLSHHENGDFFFRSVELGARDPRLWDLELPEIPEVYACDVEGNPTNAFVTGGQEGDEVGGEIFVAGSGFPPDARMDVYIVRADDMWIGHAVPNRRDESYVHGPIRARSDEEGHLAPLGTRFRPETSEIGPYDILVDVDRDGVMNWSYVTMDSGDGLGEQVGFTVQLSQQWFRELPDQHVLVNIAFTKRRARDGEWSNEFTEGDTIYGYLNPPVRSGYHFTAIKWIVRHQDFETFWNNYEMMTGPNLCIPFKHIAVTSMEVPLQQGCTNTAPVPIGIASPTFDGETEFDIVFDRDHDGCYEVGRDLLDVVGGDITEGVMLSYQELMELDEKDRVDFRVSDPAH